MGFKLPSKKIAIAVLALGISVIGQFFIAHPAHAATASWVNRRDILVDGVTYRDVNSLDTTIEFVEQTTKLCKNTVKFAIGSSDILGNVSVTEDQANKFYYTNNGYGTPFLTIGKQITTGAGNVTCSNSEPRQQIDVANKGNRKIVFYLDPATDQIINIITGVVFARSGSFLSYPRYVLASEQADPCADMIVRHGVQPFDTSFGILAAGDPEQFMLYAVSKNNDLSRTSESYDTISEPNTIDRSTCHVDSDRLTGYNLTKYDGSGGDRLLLANGLNAQGNTGGGDLSDDAFVLFMGSKDNLPPNGSLPSIPSNDRCQVPGKQDLPKDDVNCVGDQPQVCTVSEDGLANALAWIICPITDAVSRATVFVEEHLILPYLAVNPLSTDPSAPNSFAYRVWDSFRSVANVLFIVAFFILIFSQATGVGISSYGIKRLLPRLIVVAVAANLSFFIVAFLIDIFNLIGQGIGTLLMNTVIHPTPEMLSDPKYQAVATGPNKWQYITLIGGALVAGFLTSGAALSWIFPLLLLTAFVVFIAVVALIIRQLLILLLVVLSPIAFVAWLLPNTEKYFSKWGNLLFNLLLMYPFIILLFALGKVLGQFFATNQIDLSGYIRLIPPDALAGILGFLGYPAVANYSTADEVVRVIAQLLSNVLPLVFIPGLIVTTNKMVGAGANFVKNGLTKAGSGAKGAYEKSSFGQFRKQRSEERNRRIAAGNYVGRGGILNPRNYQSAASRARNRSRLFNTVTGGYGASRALTDRTLRAKDRDEAKREFNNDTNLARAWALAQGDVGRFDSLSAMDLGLNDGGAAGAADYAAGIASKAAAAHKDYLDRRKTLRQAFSQMHSVGRHRSAESFIAAQEVMTGSGEGDKQTESSVVDMIRKLSPGSADIDIGSLQGGSIPAWRSSGRADIVGWTSVRPENISRYAFTGPDGSTVDPAKVKSFQDWLNDPNNSDNNRESILRSWGKIDPRAQAQIEAAYGGKAAMDADRTKFKIVITG